MTSLFSSITADSKDQSTIENFERQEKIDEWLKELGRKIENDELKNTELEETINKAYDYVVLTSFRRNFKLITIDSSIGKGLLKMPLSHEDMTRTISINKFEYKMDKNGSGFNSKIIKLCPIRSWFLGSATGYEIWICS